VALTPELVPKLKNAGLEILVQAGAGEAAGFLDSTYASRGARLEADSLEDSDVILKVQPPTADEIARIKEGAVLIGLLNPYANSDGIRALAARNITAF